MKKNIVYTSKRGTWAPHCESNWITILKGFFWLLFLTTKLFLYMGRVLFTRKEGDVYSIRK